MAFKITIKGITELQKMIKHVRKYAESSKKILQGINWYNLTGKVRKVVKTSIKKAGMNENGPRSKEVIRSFGFKKEASTRSKKGYSVSFRLTNNYLGKSGAFIPHHTWKNHAIIDRYSVGDILNFMQKARKNYTIPKKPSKSGYLKFRDRRYNIGKFVYLTKKRCYDVPAKPASGMDVERDIKIELNDWLSSIASKIEKLQSDI